MEFLTSNGIPSGLRMKQKNSVAYLVWGKYKCKWVKVIITREMETKLGKYKSKI